VLTTVLLFVVSALGTASAHYTPAPKDGFAYDETIVVSNGFGDYNGYIESTVINGSVNVTSVLPNGTESAFYYNANTYTNNSGAHQQWVSSGSFEFSADTFLYVSGTDNQTGYTNPYVWFFMNDSLGTGASVHLLNSNFTVVATSYNYALETAAGTYVKAIFIEGNGSYVRDDSYGEFTATYNWKAYFDPSTGYILGYLYTEQDSNASGDGFTLVDTLGVTHTSYRLTPGVGPTEYEVTFTETGLPSGTFWSVSLAGVVGTSSTTTVKFSEPNDSYSYTVPTISGFSSDPNSGSVQVAGSPVNQAISFTSGSSSGSGSSGSGSGLLTIALVLVVVVIIIVVIAILVARSRRRHPLPKHSGTGQVSYAPPSMGPPPPGIHLTPSGQPAVQQIVIKETVKVNCRYCGALIDTTAEKCPFCGAART
ncbi:MAG: zinc ribbon domain-containing protein, partial [Thermoplasmata archaeon]